MALIDSLTVLSSNQDVSATTLSERAIDMNALADQGLNGKPLYVHVIMKGAATKDLRVQVLGFQTPGTYTSPDVIADSGVYAAENLVHGALIQVAIPPVDRKYRVIALRYIPSDDNTAETTTITSGTTASASNYDAPPKVGASPVTAADTVDAFLSGSFVSSVAYQYANASLSTGG